LRFDPERAAATAPTHDRILAEQRHVGRVEVADVVACHLGDALRRQHANALELAGRRSLP
jgi:hypothetical protein